MKRWNQVLISTVIAGAILTGCGEGPKVNVNKQSETSINNSLEETTDHAKQEDEIHEVKNGDHVKATLIDGVTIDTEIQLPDTGLSDVKKYRVVVDGFDGEKVIPNLFGSMPEEIQIQPGSEGEVATTYWYTGNLGEQWGNMEGTFSVGNNLTIYTEHWNKLNSNFPIVYELGEIVLYGDDIQKEDFDFATEEVVLQVVKQYLKENVGLDSLNTKATYTFNYRQMQAVEAEYYNLPEDEQTKPISKESSIWGEQDNCYWIILEQLYHGIPILSRRIIWQDDTYIPSVQIEAGYTAKGLEYINIDNCFKEVGQESVNLLPMENIYEALRKKFELVLINNITINQMKLIYYPMPTGHSVNGKWEYDLVPVWQFCFQENEFNNYIYINAIDGIEIVG